MMTPCMSLALLGLEASPLSAWPDGRRASVIEGLPPFRSQEILAALETAFVRSDLPWPSPPPALRVAPQPLPSGAQPDLALALALLGAAGVVPPSALAGLCALGAMAPDGTLALRRGGLVLALAARHHGARVLLVPEACSDEMRLAAGPGLRICPVRSLSQAVEVLRGESQAPSLDPRPEPWSVPPPPLDLWDLPCGPRPRRALEIAAAGGHPLLLLGPPGAPLAALARRLPGLLPPQSPAEARAVSLVFSAAGLLRAGLVPQRPFRAPHASTALAGLCGTAAGPGELALAHSGVLFLDDLPAWKRATLAALREPLRTGEVVALTTRVRYPAGTLLVAAAPLCPCEDAPRKPCVCDPVVRARYQAALRSAMPAPVDLCCPVPAPGAQLAPGADPAAPVREASVVVAARVVAARARQAARAARHGGRPLSSWLNAWAPLALLHEDLYPDGAGAAVLHGAGLATPTAERVLRVARTLADLAGHPDIGAAEVDEALTWVNPSPETLP